MPGERRWIAPGGIAPDTGDTPLYVRFRNGMEPPHPAPADKWIFHDRGWSTDIVAVRGDDLTTAHSAPARDPLSPET